MQKITMKRQPEKEEETETISQLLQKFLIQKKARGTTDKTVQSYKYHFMAVDRYYPILDMSISDVDEYTIDEMIVAMRDGNRLDGVHHPMKDTSIKSYLITIAAFFSWAREKGLTTVKVPKYKAQEEAKIPYTQEELKVLLKKPNMRKCSFAEYRNWVIECFLMNSGARASTIREMQIQDIDFDSGFINFRHTKNKKTQQVPMCKEMKKIFKEYLEYRCGSSQDWLFPNQYGKQLTESALRRAIEEYNHSRGVKKTSIHLFRHTFAKMYIQNGGDCLKLQKILGHSSLDMTRHYVNLYCCDTKLGFEEFSPLATSFKQQKIDI